MSEENGKQEIIEMILSAGLLEDFISYLRKRKVNLDDIKSIYNINEEIVREYAIEKKLVVNPDSDAEGREGLMDAESYEPVGFRPRTPPRKK